MSRKLLDLWVGVFVVVGFSALLFLALRVGGFSFDSRAQAYSLTAKFDNIGGLKVRGPVKSAGVTVGRVTRISFDGSNYQAVVTLAMDGRYRFPRDTFASILTSGILGEQYIGLDVGGDEDMLQEGDTFMKTQSAMVLERLIGQFMFSEASKGAEK